MALPKLGVPEFYTEIPSTGNKVKFRPFTVKQQKALLFALQSQDLDLMIDCVHDIVDVCCYDVSSNKLAAFDIEYLFIKIRAKSVGEVIDFYLRHGANNPCQHRQQYALNIDDVKVNMAQVEDPVIKLEADLGVTMKYPSFREITKFSAISRDNPTQIIEFVASVIENVFNSEDVFGEFTLDEMVEWVSNLPTTYFEQLIDWLTKVPKLEHTIEYVCDECKQSETVELKTLSDFFISA